MNSDDDHEMSSMNRFFLSRLARCFVLALRRTKTLAETSAHSCVRSL